MIKITDSGFLSLLQTKKYKSALRDEHGKLNINGSYLDETAPAVLNKTKMDIRNQFQVANLKGIEAFTHLKHLKIEGWYLEEFPTLPPQLETLIIKGVLSTIRLTKLPSTLKRLVIDRDFDTAILPQGLVYLNCSRAEITTLSNLPNTLKELDCSDNHLKYLTHLPECLELLDCSENKITALEELPCSLKTLNCSNNQLTRLTGLPKQLETLDCSYNKIRTLDNIPPSIQTCYCNNNQVSQLPIFPKAAHVDFSNNPLKKVTSYFAGKKEDHFNLKLVLLEALSTSDKKLAQALLEQANKGTLKNYIQSLSLSKKQLASITSLTFDGGHHIYRLLDPHWDGEDDTYTVSVLDGIDELKNLKSVICIALVEDAVMDAFYLKGWLE